MKKDTTKVRDFKGDEVFGPYDFDWRKHNKSASTFVFKHFDSIRNRFIPHFNLYNTYDLDINAEAKKNSEFFLKELYKSPEAPPYDFHIQYSNWQLGLRVEFFKEVFEEKSFIGGYQPMIKYCTVILPKKLYFEICNCINDYELLEIKDLIFELIAFAQDIYTDDIYKWESSYHQKIISTAEKESQKTLSVIEKTDDKTIFRLIDEGKKPSELFNIKFTFNDETIKIEHPWIINDIVDSVKNNYNNKRFKNWRLELENYSNLTSDLKEKDQFKYTLAKSFYNLFVKCEFFKVEKPYPNNLMLCIANLLEFCLIKVVDEGDSNTIKIKNIRNWLKRNELIPDITYEEIPVNKEILLKYFEPDFLELSDNIKRADVISLAWYLGERFDIHKMISDFTHIASCLQEQLKFRTHQLLGKDKDKMFPPQFQEFKSFSKLINGIRGKQKIISLKFKLDGDETEYELKQRLPLHLIEESIKDCTKNHQVEFDTDIVKTTMTSTGEDSFTVSKDIKFNLPEERLMVRFVKSFYDYLLQELPPIEKEYKVSSKYYTIIAIVLQETGVFYQKMDSEKYIVSKVQYWHEQSVNK